MKGEYEVYALYRMVTLRMTFSDPQSPQITRLFSCSFISWNVKFYTQVLTLDHKLPRNGRCQGLLTIHS